MRRLGQTHIEGLYREYQALLAQGKSHDEALAEFDYLHAISLARLKKMIVEKSGENVEKGESA